MASREHRAEMRANLPSGGRKRKSGRQQIWEEDQRRIAEVVNAGASAAQKRQHADDLKRAADARAKATPVPAKLPPKPRSKKQVMGVLAALTAAEEGAVQRFAASHGPQWKQKLTTRWMKANVQQFQGSEPSDPTTLYALRSKLGPDWLVQYGEAKKVAKKAAKKVASPPAKKKPAKKAKPPAKAKPAKKAKPPAKAPKPKAKPPNRAKPAVPEVTESAIRGACAAGTGRWRLTQQQADKECKADEKDKEAFGELGGAASAAAKSRFRVVLGKLVKV